MQECFFWWSIWISLARCCTECIAPNWRKSIALYDCTLNQRISIAFISECMECQIAPKSWRAYPRTKHARAHKHACASQAVRTWRSRLHQAHNQHTRTHTRTCAMWSSVYVMHPAEPKLMPRMCTTQAFLITIKEQVPNAHWYDKIIVCRAARMNTPVQNRSNFRCAVPVD